MLLISSATRKRDLTGVGLWRQGQRRDEIHERSPLELTNKSKKGSELKPLIYTISLIAAISLVSCGQIEKAKVPATTQVLHAQVRVAHLSPDAPAVDIWVDGARVLENVPFKAVSDYLNLQPGEHRIQVSPAGASEPIVIDATVSLEPKAAYTVAATGLLKANDLKPMVLGDIRKPEAAKAKVRFVHTSPDAPAVDVAVTGGPVLFKNVAFRKSADYIAVDAGSYDLEVRLAGTETVALRVPGVKLSAATNYSVFAVGLAGDGSLSALPKVDGGV